jgi:hypothetical protein
MEGIPFEILTLIFSFLGKSDRKRCAEVCVVWRCAAVDDIPLQVCS